MSVQLSQSQPCHQSRISEVLNLNTWPVNLVITESRIGWACKGKDSLPNHYLGWGRSLPANCPCGHLGLSRLTCLTLQVVGSLFIAIWQHCQYNLLLLIISAKFVLCVSAFSTTKCLVGCGHFSFFWSDFLVVNKSIRAKQFHRLKQLGFSSIRLPIYCPWTNISYYHISSRCVHEYMARSARKKSPSRSSWCHVYKWDVFSWLADSRITINPPGLIMPGFYRTS